ncbi:MAG: methylmalonyl-CoA carboxyltransferase [Planctomycetota bacterium]|nr:methylmalonyl-CoA carboxyltransferase [Planctomycetota bacterium]
MTWEPELQELEQRRQLAYRMGGEERVRQQHKNGKLTVRERIDGLVDAGSFREQGVLAGSGVYEHGRLKEFRSANTVIGLAKVDGRRVVVSGADYTARPASGGAGVGGAGRQAGNKGLHAQQMSLEMKLPMIRLIDGFGADIRAVQGMGRTYLPGNTTWGMVLEMMSQVPVISAALGSVAGLPAAEVAACHFAVMVKDVSQVFAAGPPVVERALGLRIHKEELGGYRVHARGSGLVDNEAEDEPDAFRQIRAFLSYLPSNVYTLPPVRESDDPPDRREPELLSIIPRDRNRPYDVRRMLDLIGDRGSAFEMGRYYGGSQVTMFARFAGRPVGVLANDPLVHGGAMDADAAQKLEKFVNLCDSFHLPVVNFSDQPGFMIGRAAEAAGTLKQGMRGLAAVYSATIPWASVVVRRVYGVAGGGQQNHARFNFRVAWPSGEWGSLPIEGGVQAAYRREIEASDDPAAARREVEERLVAMRSPFTAAEAFNIEDIIDPRETRPVLCEWVEAAYDQLPPMLGRRSRWLAAL